MAAVRLPGGSSGIQGFVNNWPATPTANPPNFFINDVFSLASLPSSTLPAGYTLTVALTFDGNANVTGATYTATGGGNPPNSQTEVLTTLGEAATDLSPIVAFEVDIVGINGGATASFSSGAGTITYSATSTLTALGAEPLSCVEWNGGTLENPTASTDSYRRPPAPPSRRPSAFPEPRATAGTHARHQHS